MSTAYRFAKLPSNASVAAAVTLAVSGWLTVAAGTMLVDAGLAHPNADVPQHAVLMEEAAPASPTPLPVAAAPQAHEKIVVEAQRLAPTPVAYERIVVEAHRVPA